LLLTATVQGGSPHEGAINPGTIERPISESAEEKHHPYGGTSVSKR